MSDTSQGPGWWQASDGKWYPPELYPKDWQPGSAGQASSSAESVVDTAASTEAPVADMAPAAAEAASSTPTDPGPAAAPSADPGEAVGAPAASTPAAAAPSEAELPISGQTPAASAPSAADTAADWAEPAAVPISSEPATPTAFGSAPSSTAPDQWGAAETATPGAAAPTAAAPVTQASPVIDPTATAQVPASPPGEWSQPQAAPLGQTVGATETPRSDGDTPSGILGIVGGLALVVGSFLAWATAGGTLTSGNVNGLSGSNGWGTLICGLVVASGAALLFAGLRRWWVGAGMTVAALVAAGLVIFSITDIGSTSDDLPGVLRDAGVDEATAAGAQLDLDLGIWIVAAGAAVSLIAGIVALVRRQA